MPQHKQTQSKLLYLPTELREQVFCLTIGKEKAISYQVNRYQERRSFAMGKFERGKDRKVAKREVVSEQLGLSLLGPICRQIYWHARGVFFGRNHFVIENTFSIADLFFENPFAASHIRSLTLNFEAPIYDWDEPHPSYPDRAWQKPSTIFLNLLSFPSFPKASDLSHS